MCCFLNLLPGEWRALAVAGGAEVGSLVLTHLSRECQPLVRFRTGDIVALTGAWSGAVWADDAAVSGHRAER
jgi:ribonuclease BN (tRNA processing enzyme)